VGRLTAPLVLGFLAGVGAPAPAVAEGEPTQPAKGEAPLTAPDPAKAAAPAKAAPAKAAPAKAAPAKATPAKAAPAKAATPAKAAPAKAAAAKAPAKAGKPKAAKAAGPARPRKVARAAKPAGPSRFNAPTDATTTPAYRYAALSQVDCEAELKKRGIAFAREPARGVLAPVRLAGPLQGVVFRTDLADAARATSPWELADCRLVLSLDDLAAILKQHDVVEVRHYSMYRPPPASWPEDQRGARHNGGLALDAARFVGKDGSVLDVDKHFHGAIGAKTCGPGAEPRPATPEAVKLRAILCEAVDRRLFNVVLTPNYNRPHKNHFHLEVTENVTWFLVH
jgi:hypothetical protein